MTVWRTWLINDNIQREIILFFFLDSLYDLPFFDLLQKTQIKKQYYSALASQIVLHTYRLKENLHQVMRKIYEKK